MRPTPLIALVPGCEFGMDYSGDETGLQRDSIPVEGHAERRLSYLIDEHPDLPRVIFIHGSPGRPNQHAESTRSVHVDARIAYAVHS